MDVVEFMGENISLLQSIEPKRTEHGYSIAHAMSSPQFKKFIEINSKPNKYLYSHNATKCNSPGLFLRWMKKNNGINYEDWAVHEKVKTAGKVVYFSSLFGSETFCHLKLKRPILPKIVQDLKARKNLISGSFKDVNRPSTWFGLKNKNDIDWQFSKELEGLPRMVKTALILIAAQYDCAGPSARIADPFNIYNLENFDAAPPELEEIQAVDILSEFEFVEDDVDEVIDLDNF